MGALDTVEESLSVALNGLVPVAVVQELERWVERQAAGFVRPLRSALVSLSSDVPAIQKPSDAQSPLPIGPIFAACHPSRFRTAMEGALDPESLWQSYQSTLDLIVQFTPEGPLFDRYRLPQPVFMDAMNQGVKTLANMQTALVQYAVELNGLAESLRVLRGGRGVKTGLKVGASILGGMLLGPLGARAASFITGEMTSKHEEVYEVLVGVKARFAELMKVVLPICDDVETDLARVLLDVYGGLLIRVGEDLREAGRGIVQVSFAHGLVLVHLADDELRQLRDGVEGVRTAVEASVSEENWSDVAERSHAMLEWLLALPGRSWVGPETHSGESVGVGVESYTVLFARWRALALRKLGDAAWNSGDLARAGSLYRFLLEASPVAFGVEGAKDVGPTELAVAGWRLALMSAGGADMNVNNALVRHVVQAQARRQVAHLWLPGEGISRATWVVADWIEKYCVETVAEHDVARDIPLPLQADIQLLRAWRGRKPVGKWGLARTLWDIRRSGDSANVASHLQSWSRKTLTLAAFRALLLVVLIPGIIATAVIVKRYQPHLDETAARVEERAFEAGEGELVLDLLSEYRVEMVTVEPGVQVSNVEVPAGLYSNVMQRMGWKAPAQQTESGLPIVQVSWKDAVRFCNGLSAISGLDLAYREFRKRTELPSFGWFDQPKSPGVWGAWEIELVNGTTGYRLPTADEWIRAAKGGTNDRWAGTDKEWRVCRYANVASRGDDGATALPRTERFRCRDKVSGLAEVGQFRPNGFGLYDMSGNVSEWTQTAFGGDSQSWIVVGDNFESGPNLSLRDRPSRNLKSSQKAETIGFRLLRSAAAKVSAP